MFGQIAVGFDQIQHVPDSDVVFDNRDTGLKALEIKQPEIALRPKRRLFFWNIDSCQMPRVCPSHISCFFLTRFDPRSTYIQLQIYTGNILKRGPYTAAFWQGIVRQALAGASVAWIESSTGQHWAGAQGLFPW